MKARRAREAGFTLVEAMAAVAVMGVIVLALSTIAGQWMPNWRRGFNDLQRADLLSLGLERVVADVSAAEAVSPYGAETEPLFLGDALSVIFVRSAIGPDISPHLEVVRLAETVDERGFALVRTRAPFTTLNPGASPTQFPFADPVVLTRSPFRLSFGYAGPDRIWGLNWRGQKRLPTAVRITVRDARSEIVLAASTATTIRVTAMGPPPAAQDAAKAKSDPDQPPNAPNAPDAAANPGR